MITANLMLKHNSSYIEFAVTTESLEVLAANIEEALTDGKRPLVVSHKGNIVFIPNRILQDRIIEVELFK